MAPGSHWAPDRRYPMHFPRASNEARRVPVQPQPFTRPNYSSKAMSRGPQAWASMPVAFRARGGGWWPLMSRHALDGGGRLQAVDEVRCALCVAGRGEDRAVV